MLYRKFLLTLLLVSLALSGYVLWPFLHTIVLAILLAVLSQGLQRRLLAALNGRETLAALVTTSLVVLLIVLPLSMFLALVTLRALDAFATLARWLTAENIDYVITHPSLEWLMNWLRAHADLDAMRQGLEAEALNAGKLFGQWALSSATRFFGGLIDLGSQFLIMIFALFYFIRDGRRMIIILKELAPLRSEQEDRILGRIEDVTKSVVYGGFLTGLFQGVASGIGLWISGVSPFFWSGMVFLASFLPVVGTALVLGPLAIYLFIASGVKTGAFFAIWCVAVVGTIDNFLRPFLMEGKAKMSPFLIFMAILGGMAAFGVKGLIYGPLILSFAMVMTAIYRDEFRGALDNTEMEGAVLVGPGGQPLPPGGVDLVSPLDEPLEPRDSHDKEPPSKS